MDRNEILLKEYEVCQSDNNAIASQIWLSTSIFISINLTLFGGLLYALFQSKVLTRRISENPNFMFVIFLGLLLAVAVVLILCGWRSWLQRTHHLSYVNNVRMRQIEDTITVDGKTVMRKNWLVRGLDLMYREGNCHEKIPEHIQNEIEEKVSKKVFNKKELAELKRKRTGFDSLSLIVCTAIGLWLATILATVVYTTISLVSNDQYIQLIWILLFIIIVGLVTWRIKKKCLKKEIQSCLSHLKS